MAAAVASIQSAVAIGICFPILGAIFVALRFYSRWHHKKATKIDDWLCIPAWLCVTGCCISLLIGVYGDAFDGEEVSDPSSVTAPQRLLAQTTGALVCFYLFGSAFIKLSMLYFYRRIFVGRAFNICTLGLIGFTIVWLVYAILAWLLYCGPNLQANFEGGWAVCPSYGFAIQIGTFVADSIIDLALLILPIPFILKLQLNLTRKIIIILVFLLGGFAFVASLNNTIIQLVFLTQPNAILNSEENSNTFFQGPSLFYAWPPVEIGVGLIACNLPTLSSRGASALPTYLRRGWNSLSAKRSSMKSSLHKKSASSDFTTIASNGTTIVHHRNDEKSLDRSIRSDVPLVPLELETGANGLSAVPYALNPTRRMEMENIRPG